jgi:hypothetical protein
MKLALLAMTFERSLVERSEKRGGGCALALGGFSGQPPTLKRGESLAWSWFMKHPTSFTLSFLLGDVLAHL